jgi:hypothetical protein
MSSVRRILVATDYGAFSEWALETAASLLARTGGVGWLSTFALAGI